MLESVFQQRKVSPILLLQRIYSNRIPMKHHFESHNSRDLWISDLLLWAIQKLRPFLLDKHFIIFIDHHRPLKYLFQSRKVSSIVYRWRVLVGDFNFEVKYFRGEENALADALFRVSEHSWCRRRRWDDYWRIDVEDSAKAGPGVQGAFFRSVRKKYARIRAGQLT